MDKKEVFLNEVINIINANINNSLLNGALIGENLGISRMHLHRQLRRYAGCNTREFILKIRLEYAKCQLQNTNKFIYNISKEIGFLDAAYFSKIFKQEIGILPKEYR